MNVSILKRIEAIEGKVFSPELPPSLIMIHFDSSTEEWCIKEFYTNGTGKKQIFKEKVFRMKQLRDYCFREHFQSRVILNTFGCNDANYFEDLFSFDVDELRKDLQSDDTGAFFIESIRETDDFKNTAVITACARHQEGDECDESSRT